MGGPDPFADIQRQILAEFARQHGVTGTMSIGEGGKRVITVAGDAAPVEEFTVSLGEENREMVFGVVAGGPPVN